MAQTTSPTIANGTDHSSLHFADIPSCIEAFSRGEFLIVLDSPSRENEGDLIIAASHFTPSRAAFMIRHTSGYICAPMPPARAALLALPPMVPLAHNADPRRTNYTVSVDATGRSMTTGISATDRSTTAQVLGSAGSGIEDLVRPGHVVPLVARAGGVRQRPGHTEAGVELARLAGLEPAVAIIAELVVDGVREEGGRPEYVGAGMMRAKECVEFGREWGIKCCTIEDLVEHVEAREGKWEGEKLA